MKNFFYLCALVFFSASAFAGSPKSPTTFGGSPTSPMSADIALGSTTITGTLPTINGGTGTATAFTKGSVVFAGTSGFYDQNNAKLFWNNTDYRLGIGTNAPLANLHLNGTATTNDFFIIQNTDTTGYSRAKYVGDAMTYTTGVGNAGATIAGLANKWYVHDITNSQTRLVIGSTGLMGVGTTNPASPLSVHGGVSIGTSYSGTAAPSNGLIVRGRVGIATDTTPTPLTLNAGGTGSFIGGYAGSTYIYGIGRYINGLKLESLDQIYFLTNAASLNGGTLAMTIDASGYLTVPGVYGSTTASAANVFVTSAGLLQRSTSSRRYKNSVVDYTRGLADVENLRPVFYKGNNDGDKLYAGLIAEDVHAAGLTEFVQYDDEGKPDALAYSNMIALAVAAIKELDAKNSVLEQTLILQSQAIEEMRASIITLQAGAK